MNQGEPGHQLLGQRWLEGASGGRKGGDPIGDVVLGELCCGGCPCDCLSGCSYLKAGGVERTCRYRQEEISAAVPLLNQQHFFDLQLERLGPYSIDYSRNGRSVYTLVW